MDGSHSGFEDSKSFGDDEEVSRDLQGYLEVEEGMGMWEVFCDITDTIWVARSPAHACLANKSTKLINMGRPLQHVRFEEDSQLSSLSTIQCHFL